MATTGWYNDETDPALARWYDGAAWTEHVVVKADWEGYGPPPPPDELEPEAFVRVNRLRTAVGSAAVVAVLVVGGAALARDGGGGDPPDRTPTHGRSDTADSVGADDGSDLTDVVGDDPSVDPASGTESGVGTDASTGKSGTSRTTPPTRSSGGVQRTETATNTHINPGSSSNVGGGDKASTGHTSDETIKDIYAPAPAPPASSSTVAGTPSTEATSTTVS